ncbi:MAG: hypothetical protein K940chlam5_01170 [Candidatus Anoxychlamydiales bacterium]|nr:hypothetical protein [Candidatus Anoxychlamydiales bacterium]
MSVNFDPNKTNMSPVNNENPAPVNVSGESDSAFKEIPPEVLSIIFQNVPLTEMNRSDVGPQGVSKRWRAVTIYNFHTRSLKSPKKSTPLKNAPKISRLPLKKRLIAPLNP